MTPEDLRKAVSEITVWTRRGQRAPHKPLLVLLALGKALDGHNRWLAYRKVEPTLRQLLEEFGRPRTRQKPDQPYWRLQNDDGLWVVRDAPSFRLQKDGSPGALELRRQDAHAGFSEEVGRLLEKEPRLIGELAEEILQANFPESLHEALRAAVGLQDARARTCARSRNAKFRQAVLLAYNNQCAVCGFSVRLGSALLALDAAHIRWYQAGGPCEVSNGLALCAVHHQLFDRGAFTIAQDQTLLVSSLANGSDAPLQQHLLEFHRRRIRLPEREDFRPSERYLDWHWRQVFHSPDRDGRQPDHSP